MNKTLVKTISLIVLGLLLISAFNIIPINKGWSSVEFPEPRGIDEDVKSAAIDFSEQVEPQGESHHSYWNLGDAAIWTYYYSGVGVYLTYYTLSYIGTDVEIWVQNNIKFPTGDVRNAPDTGMPTKPTYEMLQYAADQFENNIYPQEAAFFGAPVFHDGTYANLQYLTPSIPDDPEYYYEPTGRAVILVCNIRDANYYDPSYPYYVIGVHIGDYESFYYDRNIITLDAVSWFHGLGPEGTVWGEHYSSVHGYSTHEVLSPFAYDSTLAHEWQHLLHYELCPGDASFMNEGCSMYAEFLCGYGIDPDYFNSYFYTPDNSLTEWGDQGDINILADYGNAALWTIYLSDQFGAEFLQYYFTSGGGGIEGITAALAHFNLHKDFDDVYHDWRLANLIRSDFPGCHKYNYESIDLNAPEIIPVFTHDISGLPVPWTKGTDFGNTITILGYDTGISEIYRYGTEYVTFENWKKPGFIYFDGDDNAHVPTPYLWTLTEDGWYSGTGVDLANEFITGNAYVDPSDPTLTVVTIWDLEDYWDFGFIQVSTDGGLTWTSLENEYTTYDHDPSAHPDVIANLPGLTSYVTDWVTMSFDLTPYAGQNVMIGFHYITDWATTYGGWLINSADVSGTALTLAPWAPPEVPPEQDFQVTIVHAIVCDGHVIYIPWDMWLCDHTEKGTAVAFAKDPSYIVMVVTPIMEKYTADYKFQATTKILCKFFN